MFKQSLILLLSAAACVCAQEPRYDSYGRLMTDYEQVQRDREAGVLQRGGYDPHAAAVGAAQRQARAGNAPTIGNSDLPNQNGVSERSIYRCKNNGRDVYVDEDGRRKFSQCQLIRRGRSEEQAMQQQAPAQADPARADAGTRIVPTPAENAAAAPPQTGEAAFSHPETEPPAIAAQGSGNLPCSGAILYKGSTYIFSEHEPCPIPAEVFDNRRPIEAEPNYYAE